MACGLFPPVHAKERVSRLVVLHTECAPADVGAKSAFNFLSTHVSCSRDPSI